MHIAVIDSGTTNSRVYIVDELGRVRAKTSREVGVRDTATTGSIDRLKSGLRDATQEALSSLSLGRKDLAAVISSGMITSEIGLVELPHLFAPASAQTLAEHLVRVDDALRLPVDPPVYFVRGIKNPYNPDTVSADEADSLDFMRGEEIQVAGLLSREDIEAPLTVVVLSSHTKFIPVNAEGAILGSLTTFSGQVFEAIATGTMLAKSIQTGDAELDPDSPEGRRVIDRAYRWTQASGLLRSVFVTRFLETLVRTEATERRLYMEAVIASADLDAVPALKTMGYPPSSRFVLVGKPRRTALYAQLFREQLGVTGHILRVCDPQEIDAMTVRGALRILRLAGIIHL